MLIRDINIIGKGKVPCCLLLLKGMPFPCLPGILGPSSGGPGGPEGGGGLLPGWEVPDLDGLGTTAPLVL